MKTFDIPFFEFALAVAKATAGPAKPCKLGGSIAAPSVAIFDKSNPNCRKDDEPHEEESFSCGRKDLETTQVTNTHKYTLSIEEEKEIFVYVV